MTVGSLAATILLIFSILGPMTCAGTASGEAAGNSSSTAPPIAFSTIRPLAVTAGAWTLVGTEPPGRDDPSWVYDSRADRFIVFGGATSATTATNATLAYDYANNTWTDLTPTVGPEPRVNAEMAYDSRSDRVVLFGGIPYPLAYSATFSDTWIFDYTNRTWIDATTAATPPPHSAGMFSYDPVADRAILFGGQDNSILLADTWAYDYGTNTWALRNPSGSPSGRDFGSMVYDPIAHASLLFGGQVVSGLSIVPSSDTYSYNYTVNAWTRLLPSVSPPGRRGAGMAYDATARQSVLFGGANGSSTASYRNDTWAYSSISKDWVNVTPVHSPSPRADAAMAFSPRADRAVLFGGSLPSGADSAELWSYEFGAALPSAPRNLVATGGTSKITLTWAPPTSDGESAVVNYSVYRGTTSGGETLLTTVGPVLTYTDSAVTAGTTYYYELSAINAVGEGPKSNQASATPTLPDTMPPTIAITAPENNSAVSSVNVTVSGTASDNVAISAVQVSPDGTTWTNATGTTAWTAKVMLATGTNTIYARAIDTSGNEATTWSTVSVQPASAGPLGFSIDIWIALIVVVAAGLAALAFLFLRRRRKPQPPQAIPPTMPPRTAPPTQPTPPPSPPPSPPSRP